MADIYGRQNDPSNDPLTRGADSTVDALGKGVAAAGNAIGGAWNAVGDMAGRAGDALYNNVGRGAMGAEADAYKNEFDISPVATATVPNALVPPGQTLPRRKQAVQAPAAAPLAIPVALPTNSAAPIVPVATSPTMSGQDRFSMDGRPKSYDKNAAINDILGRIMGDASGTASPVTQNVVHDYAFDARQAAAGDALKAPTAIPGKSFGDYYADQKSGNRTWDLPPSVQTASAQGSFLRDQQNADRADLYRKEALGYDEKMTGHDVERQGHDLAHQGQVMNALIAGGHLDLARKQFDALAPERDANVREKTAHADYLGSEGKWREAEGRRQDALADPRLQNQLALDKKRIDRGKLYADYLAKNPGDTEGAANAAQGADMLEQGKVWIPGTKEVKGEHNRIFPDKPGTPATPGRWADPNQAKQFTPELASQYFQKYGSKQAAQKAAQADGYTW